MTSRAEANKQKKKKKDKMKKKTKAWTLSDKNFNKYNLEVFLFLFSRK